MAFSDVWNGIKKKVEDALYNGEAEPRQPRQPQQPRTEEMGAPAPDMGFTQQGQAPYYDMNQQGYQQQYAPQGYQPQQMPPQPQYTDYHQQGYQPPQPQQPSRFGRFGAAREKDNVVDFADYQNKNAETAPQQMEAAPQQSPVAARVIGVRGMGDCRTAITILRSGDAVLVTMENVKDPAEMRRLVDTLSGACYSLNASITKVSRIGVYLLAPQTMPVYTDQTVTQMNGPRPQPQQQPAYQQPQQPGYQPQQSWRQPQQQMEPQQLAYQPSYEAQQPAYQQPYSYQPRQNDGFTQRTAAPQENMGTFYARQGQQPAQMPAFSSPSANTGYVPDDMEVAE